MSTPGARLDHRDAGIDLVRGVSILLVMIDHVALRIPLAGSDAAILLPHHLLAALSTDGYEAVFAFFVVSGFLITRNAIRRWGALSTLAPRAFYVRRAARILPCLLALLAVLAILDRLHAPDFAITRPGQSLGGAALSALAFHLNWYEGRTGYLPPNWDVLWSLSIEEAFYIVFPLACLAAGRAPRLLAALLAILAASLPATLAALAHAPAIWRHKAYLPGMAAIATGVAAALATARRRLPASLAGWGGLALLGTLFWWEAAAFRLLGPASLLMLTVGTALLMIAFDGGWGERRGRRRTAWLRSFGRMSYEIYLTHMFAVLAVVRLFRWSGAGPGNGWAWLVAAIGLAWLLGWIVERLLSRPADLWLRRRLAARAPVTVRG